MGEKVAIDLSNERIINLFLRYKFPTLKELETLLLVDLDTVQLVDFQKWKFLKCQFIKSVKAFKPFSLHEKEKKIFIHDQQINKIDINDYFYFYEKNPELLVSKLVSNWARKYLCEEEDWYEMIYTVCFQDRHLLQWKHNFIQWLYRFVSNSKCQKSVSSTISLVGQTSLCLRKQNISFQDVILNLFLHICLFCNYLEVVSFSFVCKSWLKIVESSLATSLKYFPKFQKLRFLHIISVQDTFLEFDPPSSEAMNSDSFDTFTPYDEKELKKYKNYILSGLSDTVLYPLHNFKVKAFVSRIEKRIVKIFGKYINIDESNEKVHCWVLFKSWNINHDANLVACSTETEGSVILYNCDFSAHFMYIYDFNGNLKTKWSLPFDESIVSQFISVVSIHMQDNLVEVLSRKALYYFSLDGGLVEFYRLEEYYQGTSTGAGWCSVLKRNNLIYLCDFYSHLYCIDITLQKLIFKKNLFHNYGDATKQFRYRFQLRVFNSFLYVGCTGSPSSVYVFELIK